MVENGFMSPDALAELKRFAAQRAQMRLLIIPSNLDVMLGVGKVREINAGDRVRIDGNEGAVEVVFTGRSEGKIAVKVDRGPFAGSAYVVDGARCEIVTGSAS